MVEECDPKAQRLFHSHTSQTQHQNEAEPLGPEDHTSPVAEETDIATPNNCSGTAEYTVCV